MGKVHSDSHNQDNGQEGGGGVDEEFNGRVNAMAMNDNKCNRFLQKTRPREKLKSYIK